MKIEISNQTFKRLQQHAVPLKDSPEDVIVKLLSSFETSGRAKQEKPILLDEYRPESMRSIPRRVSGFAGELWELVIKPLPEEFSLPDVYRHLDPVRERRPHVKELEASARAALQTLRDAGYIEFMDNRGQYRRLQ
ncbi:MAG: hypothetical protein K0U72_11855 [Gammaproteobacteria bacterium]|nr:hypothetical protein [Gammaproteobacteria bacterium]